MPGWWSVPLLIDLALGAVVLEIVLLATYRWRAGKALRLRGIAANVSAGLCLMLALRAGVVGAPTGWIALLLLASGIAHAFDLRARWRS